MFRYLKLAKPYIISSARSYYSIKFNLLSSYQSIYGNVNVPQKYKVDSSLSGFSNMKSADGFALGIHVSIIRRYYRKGLLPSRDVEKLRDMGFVFDGFEEKRRRILLAFKTYIDKFQSTQIKIKFKIAKDDESWPEKTRGIALGDILNNIRSGGQYSTIVDELSAMGINVENVNNCPNFELYFEALKTFSKIHGHCKPVVLFVVPEGDVRYNEESWGIPLGKWLSCIKSVGNFAKHKHRLVDLGVDFNLRTTLSFEAIYSTLLTYKNIYGHLRVPRKFVVPEGDDRYSEQSWGYKLGSCANMIRNCDTFASHRNELEALGFDFSNQKASRDCEIIYSSLVSYKNIYGHVNVPVSFKVPEGDDRYVKQAWGYGLGACLSNVRNKGSYAEHADRLMELGVKVKCTKKTSN